MTLPQKSFHCDAGLKDCISNAGLAEAATCAASGAETGSAECAIAIAKSAILGGSCLAAHCKFD
jgi:hypothetical protein